MLIAIFDQKLLLFRHGLRRNTEKLLVTMGHVHKIRNYLFHQGSLHGEIEKQSEIAKTILMPVITALLRNIVQYN